MDMTKTVQTGKAAKENGAVPPFRETSARVARRLFFPSAARRMAWSASAAIIRLRGAMAGPARGIGFFCWRRALLNHMGRETTRMEQEPLRDIYHNRVFYEAA